MVWLILAAQQQPLGEGVDDGLAVAGDGHGDAGGLGDRAVLADQDVEDDAVDAVVLAVEREARTSPGAGRTGRPGPRAARAGWGSTRGRSARRRRRRPEG